MAICHFFLNGNCTYGDKCRFAHTQPQSQGHINSQDVCQFFLRGNCRYGDRCYKKHIVGGDKSFGGQGGMRGNVFGRLGTNQNSFAPLSKLGDNQSGFQTQNRFQNSKENEVEKTVQLIKSKIENWQVGKIWPLSCLGYSLDKPCLAGLIDYSPEELRVAAYQAQVDGTSSQYIDGVSRLIQESNARKKELSALTANALRQEEQKAAQINQKNGPFAAQSQSSLFGQSTQKAVQWGGASLNPLSSSTLPQASGFGSKSLFGTSSNASQGHNPFQNSVGIGQASFATTSTQLGASSNPFLKPSQGLLATPSFTGNNAQLQNPLGGSSFGQPMTASASPFGQSASVAPMTNMFQPTSTQWQGGASIQSQATSNPFITTQTQNLLASKPIQDPGSAGDIPTPSPVTGLTLTEKDILAFKADRFTLGHIPEISPPPEFCS